MVYDICCNDGALRCACRSVLCMPYLWTRYVCSNAVNVGTMVMIWRKRHRDEGRVNVEGKMLKPDAEQVARQEERIME